MLVLTLITLAGAPESLEEAVAALTSSNMEEADQARVLLAAAGMDAAPALMRALRSDDDTLRHNAVVVLGQIQARGAAGEISRVMFEETAHPRLRRACALALGQIGDENAGEALLRVADDADVELVKRAAQSLGKLRVPGALEKLCSLARSPDGNLRLAAAFGRGYLGDERAVPTLSELLADMYKDVRRRAAWALGLTGSEKAVAPLARLLESRHAQLRHDAALALGKLGLPSAAEALTKGFEKEKSQAVRAAIIRALGATRAQEAAPVLERAAAEEPEEVARASRVALARIERKPAQPADIRKEIEAKGKVLWEKRDPFAESKTWFALESQFLCLYDAEEGLLDDFADFIELVGRKGCTARDVLFREKRVWVATDMGAFLYDRADTAFTLFAVNASITSAPVERVTEEADGVVFVVADPAGEKAYLFDPSTGRWSGR